MLDRIRTRSTDRISIALPEISDEEQISYFKITGARRSAEVDELALEDVYDFLDESREIADPLRKVHILPLNDSGQEAGTRRPLIDYLVMETVVDDKSYVLSIGSWAEINRDYVESINNDVRAIPEVTDGLSLLGMYASEREDDYNERLANDRDWLLLDKRNVVIGGRYQRVEVCDALTPDFQFLCIKKMEDSATLSHLFSQGSVSAELLVSDRSYRAKVAEQITTKWPDAQLPPYEDLVFVYAIATHREGAIGDSLFFFSKVNIVQHAARIRRTGIQVAIAHIPRPKPKKRLRRNQRSRTA